MDENEKLEIIRRVVRKLARSYKFGYHTAEDMEQEAYCLAYEALPRWDGKRSLYTFIYTHVKNRLQTFVRDNYMKPCPCKFCYGKSNGETLHPDKQHCDKYNSWYDANRRRGNIMSPIGFTCVDDENEKNFFIDDEVYSTLERQEIFDLIDEHLPAELRASYLRMKEGVCGVTEIEREEILTIIRRILNTGLSS